MSFFKKYCSRLKTALEKDPDEFLKYISGVIHVGANDGEEASLYQKRDLSVIWIEAIPSMLDLLKSNIAQFPKQRAITALVTDKEDQTYQFNIANNLGKSSSIYDFKDHKNIWPDVGYQESITLSSTTLTRLIAQESIDMSHYQALVMDTQGSELLILMGAIPLIPFLQYIKVEVADFEIYEGCCQLKDINEFMHQHGFHEIIRKPFPIKYSGGMCYDIVFQKNQ